MSLGIGFQGRKARLKTTRSSTITQSRHSRGSPVTVYAPQSTVGRTSNGGRMSAEELTEFGLEEVWPFSRVRARCLHFQPLALFFMGCAFEVTFYLSLSLSISLCLSLIQGSYASPTHGLDMPESLGHLVHVQCRQAMASMYSLEDMECPVWFANFKNTNA